MKFKLILTITVLLAANAFAQMDWPSGYDGTAQRSWQIGHGGIQLIFGKTFIPTYYQVNNNYKALALKDIAGDYSNLVVGELFRVNEDDSTALDWYVPVEDTFYVRNMQGAFLYLDYASRSMKIIEPDTNKFIGWNSAGVPGKYAIDIDSVEYAENAANADHADEADSSLEAGFADALSPDNGFTLYDMDDLGTALDISGNQIELNNVNGVQLSAITVPYSTQAYELFDANSQNAMSADEFPFYAGLFSSSGNYLKLMNIFGSKLDSIIVPFATNATNAVNATNTDHADAADSSLEAGFADALSPDNGFTFYDMDDLGTDLGTDGNQIELNNYNGVQLSAITVPYSTQAYELFDANSSNAMSADEFPFYAGLFSSSGNYLKLMNIFGSKLDSIIVPFATNSTNAQNAIHADEADSSLEAGFADALSPDNGFTKYDLDDLGTDLGTDGNQIELNNYNGVQLSAITVPYSTQAYELFDANSQNAMSADEFPYYAGLFSSSGNYLKLMNIFGSKLDSILVPFATNSTNASNATNASHADVADSSLEAGFADALSPDNGFTKYDMDDIGTDLGTDGNQIELNNYNGVQLSAITVPYSTQAYELFDANSQNAMSADEFPYYASELTLTGQTLTLKNLFGSTLSSIWLTDTSDYANEAGSLNGYSHADFAAEIVISGDQIRLKNVESDNVGSAITVPYATESGTADKSLAITDGITDYDMDDLGTYLDVAGNQIELNNVNGVQLSAITVPYSTQAYELFDAGSSNAMSADEFPFYGSSFGTSGNSLLLKNVFGSTLSTITVPYATSAGSAAALTGGVSGQVAVEDVYGLFHVITIANGRITSWTYNGTEQLD